jgi:hypothetical protein
MFVTKFRAPKPVCGHDEINAENTQLKSSATLQANRSGNYTNKFIYHLILLIQIYIILIQHILAMACSHLQEILNIGRNVELKYNFVDSKW